MACTLFSFLAHHTHITYLPFITGAICSFFDDGWTDKPSKVPSWASPNYRQCNMWHTGGATEEDYYCVDDMGLTQADVTKLTEEHDKTMQYVCFILASISY